MPRGKNQTPTKAGVPSSPPGPEPDRVKSDDPDWEGLVKRALRKPAMPPDWQPGDPPKKPAKK